VLTNLIQNPGCEKPIPGVNTITDWVSVSGGDWQARTAAPAPFEGTQYFFAGASALAELRQDVDVSGLAAVIDTGLRAFVFSGRVQSFLQAPPDSSQIIVEYRDAPNTAVLSTFDSGAITNTSAWQLVTDTRNAPVGTRWIRIRLIADRNSGTNNDGFFDALSLTTPVGLTIAQPAVLSQAGADAVVLLGAFPVGQDAIVLAGPVGGPVDVPVYGGQGFGYSPQSVDGLTLNLVMPPLPVGAFSISVEYPIIGAETLDAGNVVERPWYSKQFLARAGFPPWYGVGARQLDQERPL
jgi:hypothetical protein